MPSNFHLEEKQYAPMVVINGETTFGAWCDTKDEAKARLCHLEIALDYFSYPTKESECKGREGARIQAERAANMERWYQESGRTNSIFTGLAQEHVKISNDNSE
tara:strand:- start:1993 stop:2304 length:312 start_codon:yes stop_codon:yes gene_type:complete